MSFGYTGTLADLQAQSGNEGLAKVNRQLAAMVKGIATMNEQMAQTVANTSKLGEETDKADKKTKTLIRSLANLSDPKTWYGKAWVAVRRISSRIAPEFWAIQNAAVGAMDTVESYYKFLDQRKNKEGGEKLSPMQKLALGIMDTKKGFEKGMKLQRARMDAGISQEVLRENEGVALSYTRALRRYEGRLARGEDPTSERMLRNFVQVEKAKGVLKTAQEEKDRAKRNAIAAAGGPMRYRMQIANQAIFGRVLKTQDSLKKFYNSARKFDLKAFAAQIKLIASAVAKFLLAITLIIIIFKALNLDKLLIGIAKTLFEIGKAIFQGIALIISGAATLFSGFVDLYNAVDTLMEEGNWQPILDALVKILTGALKIAAGVLWTLLGPIIMGIYTFIKEGVLGWLTSTGDNLESTGDKILAAVLLAGTAILAIYGFIAAGAGLTGLLVAAIVSALGAFAQSFIGSRAMGGPASGLTLVGERGPELVSLPAGSRVYSNQDSRAMVSGNTNNITVNVQGRVGASDAELQEIAQKIGRMVNMEVNRTTASRTRGA